MKVLQFDFVIVGSGLSGTAAALKLSQLGDVALVSKESPEHSNSFAAQGGIAAAIGPGDRPLFHKTDTLRAGNDLCREDVVTVLTNRAPGLMGWLSGLGVPFDRDSEGRLGLGLEGAHGHKRILHAGGDATGRKVMETLSAAVQDSERVQVIDDLFVASLVKNPQSRVIGLVGTTMTHTGQVLLLARRATILATGGAGQLYSHTTNPTGATGDGIALAYRVGAQVRNLEFVQFHPTGLSLATNPRFLISEAVRGAGARLVNGAFEPIMDQHPEGDLAPRDVVSRAIYQYMQTNGEVYLDTSRVANFQARFPTIYNQCLSYGLNPVLQPIPVAPAAHFLMGGISASLAGETTVAGLYAIGEVANTGVHGANRLASNSLLECLVMSSELADKVVSEDLEAQIDLTVDEDSIHMFTELPADALHQLQEVMWRHVGIVRDGPELQNGLTDLNDLREDYPDSAEILTSLLIATSALLREESRGAHFRRDFPRLSRAMDHRDTVLEAKVRQGLFK